MSDPRVLGQQVRPDYASSVASRPSRPQPFDYTSLGGGMTDYERELQPVYRQEMESELDERRWVKPLKWVFDRLQTGQYISANVADMLIQTAQGVPEGERQTFMEAVVSGATGQRKGSYEDVLRDTLGVGQKKLFQNAPEGKRRGQVDWADVLGFVGDILLDPTTYMTFGGATKGAQIAASSFADDSVRLFLRQMSSDPNMLAKVNSELAQAGGEGISSKAIEKALAAGGAKGRSMVEKIGGDLGRVMDRTYQAAYREGLAKTQNELASMTLSRLEGMEGVTGGIEDIMTRVTSGAAYEAGGEKFGLRIAGKELLKGQDNVIPNLTRNTWNRFANFFEKGAPGEKFSDAVWGMMNRGPVGEIRRALGFRNPYQKYLRSQELTQGKVLAEVSSNTALKESFEPLRGLDEAKARDVLAYMAKQEEITAKAISAGQTDDVIGRALREGAEPEIVEAANKLKETFDRWNAEESRWAARLGESVADYREWYVPEKFRYRQGGTNVKQVRKRTFLESYEAEKQLTKALYGVDDVTAKRMLEADITGLGTNYREAIAERALIHGRAKSRASLFEQFKEMGIDLRDATDPAAAALKTRGRDIKNLGMRTIDHPALEGFVFDYDVAEIFDRALNVTGKQRNIFMRGMKAYANWWKGVVTSTTGFHARNFMSNTMTQFLRHGPRAFNKQDIMQSTAAVAYALKQSNPKAFLQEVGMEEGFMKKMLGMRVGNLTVRELAEEARRLGVISENTMGFSGQNIVEKVAGKEGFSMSTGPIRRASREIGNYTENISRFQSFLIDYADNAAADISKLTPENLMKVEAPKLEWAAEQAKKWFLDYGDLSEFEQGFMKNVIPFYCVPDDSEALTRDGWKRHGEIEVGDEILTYNQDTGKQEWQPVQAMNEFPFDGELEVLAGKQGAYRCTANHKWPVETIKTFTKGKWYGGEQKLIETKDLKTSHVLKLAAETDDQDSILTPREAALLGWLVTDGYFRWRGNHFESMIYQKKEGAVNVIRQLAGLWISSESVHPDTGVICMRLSTAWAFKINQYFKSKDDLPKIVTRLSNKAALAMWESMMLAEGHVNPHKKFSSFAQTPGPVLDAFQILSQILGKPFGFSIRENKSAWGKKPTAQGYIRNRTNLKVSYLKKKKSAYRGLVWCPTVENHTWVMRQNGKTIITGNSWIRKNLVNQINGVVLYPELYSLIPKIENLVEYEDPEYDPALVPDWMREEGAFPIGRTETGEFRFFKPDFAHTDLNFIPLQWEEGKLWPQFNFQETRDTIINATAPWLRDIASRMTSENGYSFLYREDLAETADAPYLMRLFASRPGVIPLLDGLLRRVGIENGAHMDVKDGKLQIDGQFAQSLEDYIPVLRQLEFLFYLPQSLPVIGPILEETIENVTYAQDDYEATEQTMQMLSYYLGIKTIDKDIELEKQRLGRDIYFRARDVLSEQRSQAPGAETRRLDYWRGVDDSVRRLQ